MYNDLAYRRCSVDGEGKIKTDTGDIRLRLMDISAAGAVISVPRALGIKKSYQVQLTFDISIMEKQLNARAEIMSLTQSDEGQYFYDIRFLNLNNSDRVEIDEAINHSFALEDGLGLIS